MGEIAEAAAGVFLAKGYQAAGVSDVSAALGLSHGAVYTYAKSKEALLYLALLRLIRPDAVDGLAIPVPTPTPEEIVALIDGWATDDSALPVLAAASGRRTRAVEDELGEIVDELYGFIDRNLHLLALVERCAADLPELAQYYFVQRRRGMLDTLSGLLRRRIRSGALNPVPDVPAAARFIVETIAWFAWHRVGDPDSASLEDAACRATVRHLVLAAFVPRPLS